MGLIGLIRRRSRRSRRHVTSRRAQSANRRAVVRYLPSVHTGSVLQRFESPCPERPERGHDLLAFRMREQLRRPQRENDLHSRRQIGEIERRAVRRRDPQRLAVVIDQVGFDRGRTLRRLALPSRPTRRLRFSYRHRRRSAGPVNTSRAAYASAAASTASTPPTIQQIAAALAAARIDRFAWCLRHVALPRIESAVADRRVRAANVSLRAATPRGQSRLVRMGGRLPIIATTANRRDSRRYPDP